MSLIIAEGQSSVGKSTLGDWVRDNFHIPVYHWNPGMYESEMAFTREMIRHYRDTDETAFFDRFFFTGVVYPVSTRQKYNRIKPWSVQFETWAKGELHKIQDSGRLLLIHARVEFEKWFAKELQFNSRYIDARDDFLTLHQNFDRLFKEEQWNPLAYDYTEPASVDRTHQAIAAFIGGTFSVVRCPHCGETFGV